MAILVNSHYKMPWIIYKRTYSISVASGGYINDRTLAHNLGFTPLLLGQWSTNASFNPSYDLGIQIPGGSTGGNPETMANVSVDNTNIYFTLINNATTTRTFYFKLMAFAPPNYTGNVTPVEYNSPFRFNSHYRYQQIFMQGEGAVNQSITHNLGFIPQARVWSIAGTRVSPSMGIITSTTLKCAMNNGYYYHIYKDAL